MTPIKMGHFPKLKKIIFMVYLRFMVNTINVLLGLLSILDIIIDEDVVKTEIILIHSEVKLQNNIHILKT